MMIIVVAALEEELGGLEINVEKVCCETISIHTLKGYPNVRVCITGPLEHQIAKAFLSLLSLPYPIDLLINFGSCGVYPSALPTYPLLQVVRVDRVGKHDQSIPIPNYDQYLASYGLTSHPILSKLPSTNCLTGSSFSTSPTNLSFGSHPITLTTPSTLTPPTLLPTLPNSCGHIEDMELYTLAAMAHASAIPLISVKYIVNPCTEEGGDLFIKNVPIARGIATPILIHLLDAYKVQK